jgi:hypothetical protein
MRHDARKPDAVRELTVFALRRKGDCFKGWKPHIVFKYLGFHYLAQTMDVVREGRAILGIGICYPCDLSYLTEHEGHPFDWTLPPSGNTLFVAEVIVASKRAIPLLLAKAMNKFPWINTILTYRHGKLKQLHMSQLNRLARLEAA